MPGSGRYARSYAWPMPGEHEDVLTREEGRHLFGLDPSAYEAGRPQYPEAVYRVLEARSRAHRRARGPGVGPGTGLVTRRLLEAGASVVAVEPNANLAAHLRAAFGADVSVLEATFEQARIDEGAFDLAAAATSFHWVDQRVGLAKLGRALRPGGAVALWWTLFQDPTALDAFSVAAEEVLGPRALAPSRSRDAHPSNWTPSTGSATWPGGAASPTSSPR